MDLIDKLITQRPSFHDSETEVRRSFEPSESLLPEAYARNLAGGGLTCYGIDQEVLRFLAENVLEDNRTLEIGAGYTTLVLTSRKAEHTAVTPSETEIRRIIEYAG